MSRQVKLIVYKNPRFPAHWSFWIPQEGSSRGRRIHATGDPLEGFEVSVVWNYDIEHTKRKLEIVPLGEVDSSNVVDPPEGAEEQYPIGVGTYTPRDKLEEIAAKVPAPGPSLGSAGGDTSGDAGINVPKKRVEIKNCQTWLVDFVKELVAEGIMDKSALDELAKAPKN